MQAPMCSSTALCLACSTQRRPVIVLNKQPAFCRSAWHRPRLLNLRNARLPSEPSQPAKATGLAVLHPALQTHPADACPQSASVSFLASAFSAFPGLAAFSASFLAFFAAFFSFLAAFSALSDLSAADARNSSHINMLKTRR